MAVKFTYAEPPPKAAKPWWQSKTLIVNLLIFIIAFIPPAQEFLRTIPGGDVIANNLEQVTIYANLALRFFSHGPIGGVAGAAAYGVGVGVSKGAKGLANLLPGVNIK